MELLRLWRILSKRRLWVIVPFLAVLIAAAIAASGVRPSYQATAKVLLEHKAKTASVLGPGLPETASLNTLSKTGTPLDTQVEVAQRSAILARVIRETALREPRTGAPLSITGFLKDGRVSILKGTDILAFTYRHPDREVVRRVADSWARAYEEDNRTLSRREMQTQAEFLTGQLKGSRQELDRAETALRDFRRAHARLAPSEEAKASAQTLGLLEAELRQTTATHEESAARLKALRRQVGLSASKALASSGASQNPGIQRLREQLLAAETDLALAKARLTENNPEVMLRRSQLEAVRGRLAAEAKLSLGREAGKNDAVAPNMDPLRQAVTRDLIQAEVTAIGAQSRKEALQRLVGSFAERLTALPDKELRLVQLERSASLAAERLNLLQRNLEETKIKLAMDLGSARMIEAAEVPEKPVTPEGFTVTLAGAVLGLGLGLGLALLREYTDGSIKSLEEAELAASLPTLEVLPWHNGKAGLAMLKDPNSPVSEAYRAARTRLLKPDGSAAAQALAFTSAGPREGTSTTVANLGVCLAQLGCRVLIVDADMGKPTMHRLFGLANHRGLACALNGQADLAQAIQRGPLDTLDVLTGGTLREAPADLLASPAMTRLLGDLRTRYDVILLDLPPALTAAGAGILAGRVDGLVFVMGLDHVTPEAARMAVQRLVASGGRVLGMLLCVLRRNGLWQAAGASRPRREASPGTSRPILLPAPGQS